MVVVVVVVMMMIGWRLDHVPINIDLTPLGLLP